MEVNNSKIADILNNYFPNIVRSLKIPAFENIDNLLERIKNQKENYRPVSIPVILSKIFEKILSKQLSSYFENVFSKFKRGFRKGLSTQHCLLL